MEDHKEQNEELDFEKLFGELKLDDLSTEFEAKFTQIEKRRKLRKLATWTALGLALVAVGVYVFTADSKKTSSVAPIDSVQIAQPAAQAEDRDVATSASNHQGASSASHAPKVKALSTTPIYEKPADVANASEGFMKEDKALIENAKATEKPKPEKKVEVANKVVLTQNLCDNVQINVDYKAVAACSAKNDGEINLVKVTGGEEPYSFKLNTQSYDHRSIKNLPAGIYSLVVSDRNSCVSKSIQIELPEEDCPQESDLVYSLSKDNEVNIPLQVKDVLKIVDSRGSIVVQVQGTAQQFVFNSSNVNGYSLQEGLYVLWITKANGKNLKYEITVLP